MNFTIFVAGCLYTGLGVAWLLAFILDDRLHAPLWVAALVGIVTGIDLTITVQQWFRT